MSKGLVASIVVLALWPCYLTGDDALYLGNLGGTDSAALAINGHGVVVGLSETSDGKTRAFQWDSAAAGMMDLGALAPDHWSRAVEINDGGQVVGTDDIQYGGPHEQGFLYESGAMQGLGTLGGRRSDAQAVNPSGYIAGYADTPSNQHACLWTPDLQIVDLGALGGSNSNGHGINSAAQVVGSSDVSGGQVHAFLWEDADGIGTGAPGTMYDLGAPGGTRATAWEISDEGAAVGYAYSSSASGARRACLWDSSGSPHDLGVLDGGDWSEALALNESGWIAGEARTSTGELHGVIWSPGGQIIDLNDLLPEDSVWSRLQVAADLNNGGDVVGWGYLRETGERGAFLMTDVAMDALEVSVDVKPGSWPNPINRKSRGVLPVAVCGTEDFGVDQIDPTSIILSPSEDGEGIPALRWRLRDVATPWDGEPGGGHALGCDGWIDLALKFDTQSLVELLPAPGDPSDAIPLWLRGELDDGTPIIGSDTVWLVPKGNGRYGLSAVPEPISGGLLALGGLALLRRRS
jgi:probable HAF family extracellular repeat protein